MLAWCDGTPDALDECMRTSHDKLIAMMGDLRTGGVRWQVSENVDHARTMCDLYVEGLGASMSEELGNYVRQIRGKLREYGGTVVMTMAPGRPTVRPRPGAPVQEDHG